MKHKTVVKSVRPGRIATLIDKRDPYWQHSCLRIIEWYSQVWGGAYDIIVPVGEKGIPPQFEFILEFFDPDYIAPYQRTVLDLKHAEPEEYAKRVASESPPVPEAGLPARMKETMEYHREQAEEHVSTQKLTDFEIGEDLLLQLRIRHCAFKEAPYVIARWTQPIYLTDMTTIIGRTGATTVTSLSASRNAIRLHFAALYGVVTKEYESELKNNRVKVDTLRYPEDIKALYDKEREERVRKWMKILKGDIQPKSKVSDATDAILEKAAKELAESHPPPSDLTFVTKPQRSFRRMISNSPLPFDTTSEAIHKLRETSPFALTMTGLEWFSVNVGQELGKNPPVFVMGKEPEDFCLYYDLLRLRNAYMTFWIADIAAEHLLSNIVSHATELSSSEEIVICSVSISASQLKSLLDSASSVSLPAELKSAKEVMGKIKIVGQMKETIRQVHRPYNLNNKDQEDLVMLSEGKSVARIRTPLPKGFGKIDPLEFRWISEVRVEGISVPRKNKITECFLEPVGDDWPVVARPAFGGDLAYFCPHPRILKTTADAETAVTKPRLVIPDPFIVFQHIFQDVALDIDYSDDGKTLAEMLSLFGPLQKLAHMFSNERNRRIFAAVKYYDEGGDQKKDINKENRHSGFCYLRVPRLTVFAAEGLLKLLTDKEETGTFLDEFLANGVVQRGLTLKCKSCAYADWYHIEDVSTVFVCKQCRKKQAITSKHFLSEKGNPLIEPEWTYRLHEIVRKAIRQDLDIPILALNELNRRSRSKFMFIPQINIFDLTPNGGQPEIDICAVEAGQLLIGEAKKAGCPSKKQLSTYEEIARRIGATKVLIATTEDWKETRKKSIRQSFVCLPLEVELLKVQLTT